MDIFSAIILPQKRWKFFLKLKRVFYLKINNAERFYIYE